MTCFYDTTMKCEAILACIASIQIFFSHQHLINKYASSMRSTVYCLLLLLGTSFAIELNLFPSTVHCTINLIHFDRIKPDYLDLAESILASKGTYSPSTVHRLSSFIVKGQLARTIPFHHKEACSVNIALHPTGGCFNLLEFDQFFILENTMRHKYF